MLFVVVVVVDRLLPPLKNLPLGEGYFVPASLLRPKNVPPLEGLRAGSEGPKVRISVV